MRIINTTLNFLIDFLDIHMYYRWREGMNHCKRFGTYLIGNVNISNITLACVNLNNNEPLWTGVIRDQYVKADKGKSKMQERLFE